MTEPEPRPVPESGHVVLEVQDGQIGQSSDLQPEDQED